MFGYSDKLTLNIMNVYDRSGCLLYLSIPFPLNDENIIFPETTAMLSIAECHQGKDFYQRHKFNIYLGKESTLDELLKRKVGPRISVLCNKQFKDDKVVYYEKENGVSVIIESLEEGDIVVENTEELRLVLKQISDEFENIRSSVNKIKTLGRKKMLGGNNE